MSDPLLDAETGVFSRAAWDRMAESEISRARRYGDPLTLALVKLDDSSPDAVANLEKLAHLMAERCRQEDLIGRMQDRVLAVLAVTLNGDSSRLVDSIEEACEDFSVLVVGVSHRLTRPFAATVRDAEAALVVAERARKRASA